MKKLNALNLGKSLNREEMKSIMAGVNRCVSVCSNHIQCQEIRPDSYCTYIMCEGIKRYSCQWIKD